MDAAAPLSRRLILAVAVAALAGVALVAVTFWPGMLSADSVEQLKQARSGVYHPWHPPLMAWTWHLADKVVRGAGGMLLLQCAVLWAGLALIAARALTQSRRGWLVLLIGLWPPIFVLAAHLWKDVAMAALLTLAVGFLVWARERRRALFGALALVALFCATGLRHNAVTAVAPLTAYSVALLAQGRRRWLALSAGVALAFVFHATHGAISRRLTGLELPPLQTNFVHDLAGLSRASGESLFPASFLMTTTASEERMRQLYDPDDSDPLYFGATPVTLTFDARAVADLRAAWLRAVLHHPGRWLAQRGHLAMSLLAIARPRVNYPFHPTIDANDLGVAWQPSRWRDGALAALAWLRDSILFRGWAYLLFGAAALLWLRRRGCADGLVLAVAASAIAYLVPLFFVLPAPSFLWTVLACLLLPALGRQAASLETSASLPARPRR